MLAVTVLGHDRPGIIAEVTAALADLGGNLEDSSMTLLRGHFAWTLIVRTASVADDVAAQLEHLSADGLVVSVLAVPDGPELAPQGVMYVLSVHGADRPRIVSGLTSVLASYGANVTDLRTHLGSGLYVLVAEVEFPAATDIVAVQQQLDTAATELGVGATLRPADVDVL